MSRVGEEVTDSCPSERRRPDSGNTDGRLERRQRVGELLRNARETQQLSQFQVATLTDGQLSRTSLSDIERGHTLPGLETLVVLTRVLHVDPLEVLEQIDLGSVASCDPTRPVLEPRQRVRMEIDRAVALHHDGALKTSMTSIKQAAQLATDFPEALAECYTILASWYARDGFTGLARIVIEQAIELAAQESSTLAGEAWNQKGHILFQDGAFGVAREAFLHARKFLLKTNDPYSIAEVEIALGTCLYRLKRFDPSRRRFQKAIVLARKSGDRVNETMALIYLGEVALIEGKLVEADLRAFTALRMAQRSGRVLGIFLAEWLRYRIEGQNDGAHSNRQRAAFLRKTYPRVQQHLTLETIRLFRQEIFREPIS